MSFADKSKWVSISCSLALLTMIGCKSSPSTEEPTMADSKPNLFPQTSEPVVIDPAHPPADGATVKETYNDRLYGKTEVRDDGYIRHADSVSPTGWTPWHHRTQPHDWTGPITYESTVDGSVTARVVSVDTAKRLITLQGSSGQSETFEVGSKVQRLNEVSPGDHLTLAWTATLHGELRPPTAEETAYPIALYSIVDRASSDAAPARSTGTALRVVTTVDAVDLKAMSVTLKGPLGNQIVVRAKSSENIKKLHVGDTIVVTYSQGEAVSLTKAP